MAPRPLALARRVGRGDVQQLVQAFIGRQCASRARCAESANRFVRSWIEAHYLPRIRDYWQNEDPTVKRIDIELQPEWTPAEPKSETRMQTAPPSRLPPIEAKTSPRPQAVASETTGLRDDLGAPLDRRFTFENFVVGKSNELAHAAARRLTEADEVAFNPLFLYGGWGWVKPTLCMPLRGKFARRTQAGQCCICRRKNSCISLSVRCV